MLSYQIIEIFTSEEARYHNKAVADAVVDVIRKRKIAARCIVTRGIAGCYESGELATARMEVLSFNLPIRISVILPTTATQGILDTLEEIVGDGLIALHDLHVVSHKAANTFFPRQLRVKDVMTPKPQCITAKTPLSEATHLLLSSIFTGLPVVDRDGRPIGVLTQGDLIKRAGLPLRLGLLAETDRDDVEPIMESLARRSVSEVMTVPVITITEDRPLHDAVDMMLTKKLKRLPVVDCHGKLVGMLSRLDIFRTVMRESPDWDAFRAQEIAVTNLHTVKDILRRDTHTVAPEATIDTVIEIIDENDLQRVAVVAADGRLLGIISDRDLLRYFSPDHDGLRYLLAKLFPFYGKKHAHAADTLQNGLSSTRADEVMTTDLVTVTDDTVIEEAVRLMTERSLKRLPVIDADGCFSGMISRDSLLRTGFLQLSQQRS